MTTPSGAHATALLETKLRVPRRRRGAVRRTRLSSRLTDDDRPRLTLLSAPAGFGKTTLLTEWLADAGAAQASAAWLSLDAGDNDPARFWSYLVAAVQRVLPDVGHTALSLLRTSPGAVEAAATLLLNDLGSTPGDVVVVLDDYHVIETAEIHDAMASLVEHLPPHVRLVVASRADPPLPLARLRARGDLLEIRAADLRFTAGEAAAYFNEAMGLQLTTDEVSALEARTEGWVAALQLAALSMRGRDDIDAFIAGFTGDDRFVVDYLVEEVLQRQTVEVRSFLLATSILGRLTGALCDAVTGGTGGRATLETLDRANLFLVPLDDRRHWYRYHHLFADVLRARLLAEQPDRVGELHRRASAWWDASGDRPEAIAHAMAGHDFERAAELVELATPEMRRTRQDATLRRWLEMLPEELFPARPVLSIALVGVLMATGEPARAERVLRSVEPWLDAPAGAIVADRDEFGRIPAQVAVYRAGLALLGGDLAATISHANRALDLGDADDHLRLGAATALLGLAYWAAGDLEAAQGRYAEAVRHLVEAGHIADVMGVSLALADVQIAQGRLGDARRTFEAALGHAHGHHGLRGTADMHVGLSEVLLEHNELDEAVRHLRASADLGEHAGLPQHAYRRRVATARVRAAQGDLDGALRVLDEAELVYDTDFSPAVRPIPAMKARLHLARGDVAAARAWAADRGLTADDDLDYVHEFEYVTLARTLLAEGGSSSVEAAIGLLDRLLAAAEAGHRDGGAIEVRMLQALAHSARGDARAATSSLEDALARAAPENFVRVFLDAGPAMAALLRTVAPTGAAGGHARRVLAATRPGPATPPRHGLPDDLSSRELDVLRLLRSDLSGPEIARELFISLNTLRTHTRNIFAKLGVKNRREAVRRAEELGL